MIYTDMTRRAMRILWAYSDGYGLGKDGVPAVFHSIHVAEQMDDEISCTVALLHDILEDTSMTIERLRYLHNSMAYDFPKAYEVVILLTRKKDENYFDYIRNLKKNPVAKKVKLADLEHNMDLSRIPSDYMKTHGGEIESLQKRYKKAKEILLDDNMSE